MAHWRKFVVSSPFGRRVVNRTSTSTSTSNRIETGKTEIRKRSRKCAVYGAAAIRYRRKYIFAVRRSETFLFRIYPKIKPSAIYSLLWLCQASPFLLLSAHRRGARTRINLSNSQHPLICDFEKKLNFFVSFFSIRRTRKKKKNFVSSSAWTFSRLVSNFFRSFFCRVKFCIGN